jgi:hypothetical protein
LERRPEPSLRQFELTCSFFSGIALSVFTNLLTALRERASWARIAAMFSFLLCSALLINLTTVYERAAAGAAAVTVGSSFKREVQERKQLRGLGGWLLVAAAVASGALGCLLLLIDTQLP